MYDALDEILGTRTPSTSDSNPSSNYTNNGRSDRGEYSNIRQNGNGNNSNSYNGNGNSYNSNNNNNNNNNNRDYDRSMEPQNNMRGGAGGYNYQNDNADEYSSLSRISTQQGPGSKGTASNFSNRNEGGTSQYKLKPDDYGYDREYNGITEDTIL